MNNCSGFCGGRNRCPMPLLPLLPERDLTQKLRNHKDFRLRRRGRVAEGGGLLNRYTLQRRIEGSNPSVSARNPIVQPGDIGNGTYLRHE